MRSKVTLVYKDLEGKIAEETIWADPYNGHYKVDNIPFYAPNLAYNDIISVEEDDGVLYFDSLIKASGHSTVQVIFFEINKEKEVLNKLEEMGCAWEGMKGGTYYAIDIPPEKDYRIIKEILDIERQNSVLDYKEACLGQV
jgi:hypothetical protein